MSTPTTTTAYIYLRSAVSEQTTAQDGADGRALDHQRDLCLAKAAALNARVVKVYADCGSGTDPNRPELQQLLAKLADETVDYVIVADDARLARQLNHWKGLRQTIKAAGATLVACKPVAAVFKEQIVDLISKFATADHRDRRIRA